MATTNRQNLGKLGEDLAVSLLRAQGYQILERNWRDRGGEIDVVTRQDGQLVFVEVRARRGSAMGSPEESITARKAARLVRLAQGYVARRFPGEMESWRIDVVAVVLTLEGRVTRTEIIRDAIELTDEW